MEIKKLLINIILSVVFFTFTFAENSVNISYTPKHIEEGTEITFNLKSNSYDLSKAAISWQVNGRNFDQGIGRTFFKYTAGKEGVTDSVIAIINAQEGYTIAETSITASPYIFLYEGKNSFTPAFYKGRALPEKEGGVRMSILSVVPSDNIEWNISGKNILGQNSQMLLVDSRLSDVSIPVRATIYKDGLEKDKIEKTINLASPEVYIYETNERGNTKKFINGGEKNNDFYLKVEPYFFSIDNYNDKNLKYSWNINGTAKNISTPWFVKINSTNKKDRLNMSLKMTNSQKITQSFSRNFILNIE